MPRRGLAQEGAKADEFTSRPRGSKRTNISDHDPSRLAPHTASSLISHPESAGHSYNARRAEMLMQLQRTYGNSYVNELIGSQIIAARGHNSPPLSGPGSHGEPIIKGKGVTRIGSMRTDAYHASPINSHNPVIVWTDGMSLFFAPSQEQIARGRAFPVPEPTFVPMPGYSAEEIHWDRGAATAGGGSLLIIARKAGADDIEVTVSNTLEQVSHFVGPGPSSVKSHIAREGGQFLASDETNVSLELSGANALGDIHKIVFTEGYFRYRSSGGSHDLYVAMGPSPFAHLVERATGAIAQTFAAGTIAAIVPESNGLVHIETTTAGTKGTINETTNVDLRTSPAAISKASGHASAEVPYADAKRRLTNLNVDIKETGVRFHVAELETIEEAMTSGGGTGLKALQEFAKLEGTGPTILEIDKSLGSDFAGGLATVGGGTPLLLVREPFESSETARTSTVLHEMTHIIMGATEAVKRALLTPAERADLEGSLRFEARQALKQAKAGLIRVGEQGKGEVRPGPGTFASWRSVIGDDPELANVWIELLRRYSFIPDPEGTGELRGVSLADESRYSGVSDPGVGHPADSVDEFVASFVASAKIFRSAFIADVIAAEVAGNARGGGGGRYLRRLYSQAWNLITTKFIPLGPNPF